MCRACDSRAKQTTSKLIMFIEFRKAPIERLPITRQQPVYERINCACVAGEKFKIEFRCIGMKKKKLHTFAVVKG